METGKYWDDFEIGECHASLGRTVTESDLVNWIALTGIHDEMVMNRDYACKHTIFGRPVVPAPLTHAFAHGLAFHIGLLRGTSIGFLSAQSRALAPVFLGDTIRVEVEVVAKKRTSKPDRGVVTLVHTVTKQDGQAVMSFSTTTMVWRRPGPVGEEPASL